MIHIQVRHFWIVKFFKISKTCVKNFGEFRSAGEKKMGVDYFDCNICHESTNDCISSNVWVDSGDAYSLCPKCAENFQTITGAVPAESKEGDEFWATKEYYMWQIDRQQDVIDKAQEIVDKANLKLRTENYYEPNKDDESSEEEEESEDEEESSSEEEKEKRKEEKEKEEEEKPREKKRQKVVK